MTFTIQYDLFIVIGLTFLLGNLLHRFLIKKQKIINKLFPYALVFVPLAVIYAFIINDMPLRGFSIDPVYDSLGATSLGPQSINREGLIAMIIVTISIVINLFFWTYALFVIIQQVLKRRKLIASKK